MKKKILIISLIILFLGIAGGIAYQLINRPKCYDGYTYKNGVCEGFEVVSPYQESYCDAGYELVEKECVREEFVNPTTAYKCEELASNKNVKVIDTELKGTECIYTLEQSPIEYPVCPSGCALSEEKYCTCKFQSNPVITEDGIKCLEGKLEGDKCISYTNPEPTKKKKCAEGEILTDGKCISEYKMNAYPYYVCPSKYTLVEHHCVKEIKVDPNKRSVCPDDFTVDGDKCKRRVFTEILK